LALGAVDDFVLWAADSDNPTNDAASIARWSAALRALHVGAPASLAAPTEAAVGAVSTTSAMKRAGYTPANGAVYDSESRLAMALRDVARLVKQDIGLQVACIDYGDWDMHADLGTFDNGWMKDKLTEVASALAAFATDLGPAFDDVTVVTMSEFGRCVDENGSAGVDHGHGNAMLLLGGGVNGGQVHGPWPTLADDARDDRGDLFGATDYRTVLAEILRRRCGQGNISSIFPGLPSGDLGVVKTRST
jgi:uncharacterized protein (DUF1501 family)